jgi:hypothetical protein
MLKCKTRWNQKPLSAQAQKRKAKTHQPPKDQHHDQIDWQQSPPSVVEVEGTQSLVKAMVCSQFSKF